MSTYGHEGGGAFNDDQKEGWEGMMSEPEYVRVRKDKWNELHKQVESLKAERDEASKLAAKLNSELEQRDEALGWLRAVADGKLTPEQLREELERISQ